MPTTIGQWLWFTYFSVGSLGGWLALAAFILINKRAQEVQRRAVRID
jgi:hypothetical protein